jgi:hypothetical protein
MKWGIIGILTAKTRGKMCPADRRNISIINNGLKTNKLSVMKENLKPIVLEGYNNTKVFLKVEGIKDEVHQAVATVPKFMYPNQIKRVFPTATGFYYFKKVDMYSKKGKLLGFDEDCHEYVGKFTD